jgi:hypothetical protein
MQTLIEALDRAISGEEAHQETELC